MWCTVSSMTSPSGCRYRSSLSSGPRSRSNGRRASRVSRRVSRAASRWRTLCSSNAARPVGWTTWTGAPSRSANVVRRTGWRATTVSSARRRAAWSTGSSSRSATGTVKALVPGSSWCCSHIHCWATDSGAVYSVPAGAVPLSVGGVRRSASPGPIRAARRSTTVDRLAPLNNSASGGPTPSSASMRLRSRVRVRESRPAASSGWRRSRSPGSSPGSRPPSRAIWSRT